MIPLFTYTLQEKKKEQMTGTTLQQIYCSSEKNDSEKREGRGNELEKTTCVFRHLLE